MLTEKLASWLKAAQSLLEQYQYQVLSYNLF